MTSLRCMPSDLARVVPAWNPALVGRIVAVGEIHSLIEREWRITLLGEPDMTLTKNRRRLDNNNNDNKMLAAEPSLEPLRGDESGLEEIQREVHHG